MQLCETRQYYSALVLNLFMERLKFTVRQMGHSIPLCTPFKHACWFNPRKTTCVHFRSFSKVRSFFSDVYGVALRCLPGHQVGAKSTLLNVLDLRCSKGQGLESSVVVFAWSQGLILICLGPRPSHPIGATVHRSCMSFLDSLTWKLLEDTSNFYKRFHFFPMVFQRLAVKLTPSILRKVASVQRGLVGLSCFLCVLTVEEAVLLTCR